MSALRLRIEPPAGPAIEREAGDGPLTFGRAVGCDVVVADQSMSRQHARIVRDGEGWAVEDLGARNGTFVNGVRIEGRREVSPGDVIRVGATNVKLLTDAGEAGPPPAIGALGEADLGSSIFRSASDLDSRLTDTAPARAAARMKALNDFHRALAGPVSRSELLDLLLERLFVALQPEEGVILLRAADGSVATAASRRRPGTKGDLLVSRRLVAEVVEKGVAALVSDIGLDERFSHSESIVGSGVRSILAAPISDSAGCLGMVAVYSRAHVRRFGEEDLEMLVSLASAAALRIRNVALAEEAAARRVHDHELALAHDIQMTMLPKRFPDRPEVEVGASMIPARAVGGDLYDFLLTGDRLWFIVADAAGKGVSAALFMAMTRTLFRALITTEGAQVADVVTRMNAEIARDNERQFFVTAFVGSLDLLTGEVSCVNAGHLPPLCLATTGGLRSGVDFGSGSIALGILEDAVYPEQRVLLERGDVLVLVTDGVTEAVNPGGELYSDGRLADIVGSAATRTAADLATGIVDSVGQFAAGAPQEDDITVLAIRYAGA